MTSETTTQLTAQLTPMMRQYHAIKEEVPDALLLFRLGDFYELFYDDAVTAARELEITLTARQKDRGAGVPMCGVPYHSLETYVARLLGKGYKVAICDQAEAPRKGVKLVRREVSRVITPGTVTDLALLRPGENNFLMGVVEHAPRLGVAFLDLSTGEFRAFELEGEARWERLRFHVEQLRPREVVFPEALENALPEVEGCVRTPLDAWVFDPAEADRVLRAQFGAADLAGFGCAGRPLAVGAAGGLIHYARRTQKTSLEHISSLSCDEAADYLVLDASTVRNLELVEPAGDGGRKDTLLGVIDRTRTGMGARLLRRWLLRPSIDPDEILSRQEAVAELTASAFLVDALRERFEHIGDIERLLSKVTVGTATPRDLASLRASFGQLPALRASLGECANPRFRALAARVDVLEDLHQLLAAAVADDPPAALADGGVIRDGFNLELDELRHLSRDGKGYLAGVERRERERTGIGSLKVRFNRVFGYYIEISKANLHLAPADYVRKQTLVGAERFITEELKEYEEKILTAHERILELERDLFQEVRDRIRAAAGRVREAAAVVAEADVLAAFAFQARNFGYTRPEISPDATLLVRHGRHPVLEALAEERRAERFVPNDLFMDADGHRIHLITGPNMGGKSTFLRQNALIVILAHMGSFVPAQLVRFPIMDRVFTRIGASDNLARGRSTFMVEMTEAAIILNAATPQSLIILDEVGRGTATFDGLSIAWAVVEHVQARIGAKTLFATHYHELTELADLLAGVRNFHVTVREAGDRIVFLRKVEPGAADRSYGIEVARLAGIPAAVVDRAREILRRHEETEHQLSDHLTAREDRKAAIVVRQMNLFSPDEAGLRARLEAVDVDRTSPMEALRILAELKSAAGNGS